MKKVLILGDGPVPAPEHKTVEGGGLRCWGLARGLKTSHPDLDVTVAYNEFYKSKEKFTEEQEGVHIKTYTHESIPSLISGYDSFILSYCMGPLTSSVIYNAAPGQQIVLDCYVPIYVEASARQTATVEDEYHQFNGDVVRWNDALRQGHLFLCASHEQKRYYQGAISVLGRINPATYGEDPILVVPYGIYRDEPKQTAHPIQDLIGPDHGRFKKVLWFGGIYPWFDLSVLIDALEKLNEKLPAKLVIVGAKNPFNTHPDFLRKYDDLVAYIHSKAEGLVVLQDWVKFDERANWYLDSDLVVLINNIGLENELSWRTRLVDFVWANQAIITNGGDAVSEMLIENDAAAKFGALDSDSMAKNMLDLLKDPAKLEQMKSHLSAVRDSLYWDKVTAELGNRIKNHYTPGDTKYRAMMERAPEAIPSRMVRLKRKMRRVPEYVREHGVIATSRKASSVVARKLGLSSSVDSGPKEPRIAIVAHQLDRSGAPYVIMEVTKELKHSHPEQRLDFYTFHPVHPDNITELNKIGIKPKVIDNRDASIIFNQGDVVILNSVAHRRALLDDIFRHLESGYLKKLIWYVHEDDPHEQFGSQVVGRIKNLLRQGAIEFRIAGAATTRHYQEFFGDTAHTHVQEHKLKFDPRYHRVLEPKDFDKISVVLPGNASDGRKGQLPIFYAFAEFLERYLKPDPGKYRDFELVFVTIQDDFISRQIKKHAEKAFGERFKSYGWLSHEKTLEVIKSSNMTACYSLREALPLFVFEGMIMGHPVLRNDCSGMEEQLMDGVNGFYLDSEDFWQVVATIERVMNKEKTSNEELAHMSKKSYEMARAYENTNYCEIVDSAVSAFLK